MLLWFSAFCGQNTGVWGNFTPNFIHKSVRCNISPFDQQRHVTRVYLFIPGNCQCDDSIPHLISSVVWRPQEIFSLKCFCTGFIIMYLNAASLSETTHVVIGSTMCFRALHKNNIKLKSSSRSAPASPHSTALDLDAECKIEHVRTPSQPGGFYTRASTLTSNRTCARTDTRARTLTHSCCCQTSSEDMRRC